MMRNLFILICIILMLLFSSAYRIKACPEGWFERTLMTPEYPDCSTLGVVFCVKCGVAAPTFEMQITQIIGACSGYQIPFYIDYFQARILANYAEFCRENWKPCDEGYTEVIIRCPLCLYQAPDYNTYFLFCDESWCKATYRVCTPEEGEPVWTLLSTEYEGNPYPLCIERKWEQQAGICFHVDTPCSE